MELSSVTDLGGVDQRQRLDVMEDVLDGFGLAGDAVAFVEAETVAEGVLAKPHTGEGVKKAFVQIIRHPAAILNLT